MILYTYQPMESVFPMEEADYLKQEMIDIPGGQLMVEKGEGSIGQNYRIIRLISSDPYLYLDERYQPGNYI